MITSHTRARCALNSYDHFCGPRSAGLCGRFLRTIRIFGRGRNGVILSGDALPHELDQGQQETLAVKQPAEQHVQMCRTSGRTALSGISSSAKWKPPRLKRPTLIFFVVLEE